MASTLQGQGGPIRPTTRALAAMQTSINAFGIAAFGDLDRFAIFALILSQTHPDLPGHRPIAANSLAMSMARPFETVRRHVNALIDRGLCRRVEGGVIIVPDILALPAVAAGCATAHDAFVGFVEDLSAAGLVPPMPRAVESYRTMIGVDAAVNVMFATIESNRLLYPDWTSLTIFSTVLYANARRYELYAPFGGVPLAPAHAVRTSVVAHVLNLPETTVRRRVVELTRPDGPLLRYPQGLLVSPAWLADPAGVAASAATDAALRRVLARAATNGFPFDDPASAYLAGRPRSLFDGDEAA